MKQVPLAAKIRQERGSARMRRLRSKGLVPAEIYGHKEANRSIEIPAKELSKILATAQGENIFFNLNVEGAKEGNPVLAVLKEIQYHKLDHSLLHADFHTVKLNEKIRLRIPIRVVNADTCEGVKEGGVLQTFLRSLEIFCLPAEVPEGVQVDAQHLKIGDNVHVSDLKIPGDVKILQDPGEVVVSVAAQAAEEVKAEVAPAAGAAGEPEVLSAKKKEEGGAEAVPAAGKEGAKAEAKADAKPEKK
jgi:large subunit ribosomal protein L25